MELICGRLEWKCMPYCYILKFAFVDVMGELTLLLMLLWYMADGWKNAKAKIVVMMLSMGKIAIVWNCCMWKGSKTHHQSDECNLEWKDGVYRWCQMWKRKKWSGVMMCVWRAEWKWRMATANGNTYMMCWRVGRKEALPVRWLVDCWQSGGGAKMMMIGRSVDWFAGWLTSICVLVVKKNVLECGNMLLLLYWSKTIWC